MSALNLLSPVVAKTKVESAFTLNTIENEVERLMESIGIFRMSWQVGLVDLYHGSIHMTDLVGENRSKGHRQVSQVTVVLVVKRFGKHVGRSEGKHKVALGQWFDGFSAAFQI